MLKTSQWSPRFAGGKVVGLSVASRGIYNKEMNNEPEKQRRPPESEQGAEEEPGRHRKIQRPTI